MADESPPTGDRAVFAILELFALAFAFEGAASLLHEGWSMTCTEAFAAATLLMLAGIKWPTIKGYLGEPFTQTAHRAASDFRVWLGLIALFFIYLGMPRLLRPVGLAPELGDARQNKYVCTHTSPLLGKGKEAMLIEFGVRQFSTNGFHTQITLADPIVDYQVWYGSPGRTSPTMMGGHFTMADIESPNATPLEQCGPKSFTGPGGSLVRHDREKVFDFTSQTPSIAPRLSYYVYLATDNSAHVDKVTFFEDYFAMDNPDLVKSEEPNFGLCPYR